MAGAGSTERVRYGENLDMTGQVPQGKAGQSVRLEHAPGGERWRTVETTSTASGGSYRFVMEADGDAHEFYGSFHEVRPGELIVQTFTYAPMPDAIALEKLRFEDLGGGRTRLVSTSLVDSFEDRDAFVASGMEQGVVEGYHKLDAILAES